VVAFEHYSDSQSLRAALDATRADLNADDRLAIVGQSDALSPGLFRWELGPPSGVPCFPYELGGARKLDLALATRVLLIASLAPDSAPLDATRNYLTQKDAVLERVARGELALRREISLADMGVAFRLYERASRPERTPACR
jgi:hypothetical protein